MEWGVVMGVGWRVSGTSYSINQSLARLTPIILREYEKTGYKGKIKEFDKEMGKKKVCFWRKTEGQIYR
jgi:hypothetical protein